MSKINNRELVSTGLLKELEYLGMSLDISRSNGVVTPRMDADATWVGVDTKMPNKKLHTTTVAEYAAAYFLGRELNERAYMWEPVLKADSKTGKQMKCNLGSKKDHPLVDTEGFIYIKTADAISHFGSEAKNSDDVCLIDDVRGLFNDEINLYRAWSVGDVFNILISGGDSAAFNTKERDCFAIHSSKSRFDNIENAIRSALAQTGKKIVSAPDAIKLKFSTTDFQRTDDHHNPLKYIISEFKDKFGIKITVGNYKSDNDEKSHEVTFLGSDIGSVAEINKLCGFNISKQVSEQIKVLSDTDEFESVDPWNVVATLLNITEYNEMPVIIQHALIRAITANIKNITLIKIALKS